MSLPKPWIDKIFTKLALVYGREFMARWDALGIPEDEVKADWAHELEGFDKWPEAIAHALKHLPADKPPTVLQFRALCRQAPARELPQLPRPKADPEKVKAELAKMRGLLKTIK